MNRCMEMESMQRNDDTNNIGGMVKYPVLRLALILLISGVVGMLLLVLTNLLPAERIKNHIADGAYVILQESAEYEYADGYVSSILDNYTDSVILAKTAWPSQNPVQDAVYAPSYSWPGQSAEDMHIFGYLNGNSIEEASVDTYPRYWHGYMAFLRPFFTLFGYADLRILNQMAQLSFLLVVLYAMRHRGLEQYVPAFATMILFWNPATMGVSLQYSPCYYISMLTSLCMILRPVRRSGEWYYDGFAFLLAGVMTAYLDFLTYPLVTFGVPLVFWVLIRTADITQIKRAKFVVLLREVIRLGVCWTAGYLGMWLEKWIYGSILTGTNLLEDAVRSVTERTSSSHYGETISRVGTVLTLIRRAFGNWGGVLLVLGSVILVTVLAVRRWKKSAVSASVSGSSDATNSGAASILMLAFIGLLPFVWYFVTANHSYIHPRLVYRTMGITVFAWLSTWTMLLEMRMRQREKSA